MPREMEKQQQRVGGKPGLLMLRVGECFNPPETQLSCQENEGLRAGHWSSYRGGQWPPQQGLLVGSGQVRVKRGSQCV